jgi:hypothetical protein
MKIENVTVPALYHARFRACTPECLASLKLLSNKDLFGELAGANRRSACLREAASAKAGHAGVPARRSINPLSTSPLQGF